MVTNLLGNIKWQFDNRKHISEVSSNEINYQIIRFVCMIMHTVRSSLFFKTHQDYF